MSKVTPQAKKENIPTFTMREFLRNPKRASTLLRHGQKINVTNNGTLLFVATPPANTVNTRVTGKDFAHIKIKSSETDLSQHVDELVYGA